MITPKKNLGQNFLVDQKVINNLVKTAQITKNDIVLEIGAGTGHVTQELSKRAKKVLAVEFDRDLIPVLQKNLQNHANVKIINEDILKLNLKDMRYAENGTRITTVVGSIPFQITSPLIHKLLRASNWSFGGEGRRSSEALAKEEKKLSFCHSGLDPESDRPGCQILNQVQDDNQRLEISAAPEITLLVQREVAEKITAAPPNATYLSNFVRGLADVKYIRKVPKKSFQPQPKVDGAVIKIEPHYDVLINHNINPQEWSDFLHKGFKHPRKMLRNTFENPALKTASIDPTTRPQELEVTQWINLLKKTPTNLQKP